MLSDEEKLEMVQDANDVNRGKVFLAARQKSQEGGLDEYIEFLSQNLEIIEFKPSKWITNNFKL